ncbi:OCRE domain [Popillia japonica]|uniref:OCRE domain n=1 Tax=Popillia japonica TaxID=7064 RepID=A0AAW1L639_POPJA
MANCGDSKSAVVNTDDYYSSDSNSSTHFDNLLSVIEQKLCDLPDVWEYVISLRKFVLKQQKKIKKLQRKLKGLKRKETNEVAVQTNTIEDRISKTITEEIKEAAENAMQNQGMVYEETSGLYYDYNSGYYYNAEYGLYYDGNTGTYMSYDTESQQYVFHSQVETKTPEDKLDHDENKDQGKSQVISSSTMDSLSQSLSLMQINNLRKHVLDYSSHWPPCIRIIVEETSIPTLKTGSLYVITYEGGTLGREGKHDILLTDINVSKHHLKFSFNKDSSSYFVIDLGSRNGTLLNGKRMSSSKQESEQFEVVHGARIQIGSTVLLCHIHKGSQTCGLCEPGLLQSKEITENRFSIKVDKNADHKQQLKKLRKKFAVNHSVDSGLAPGYTDRAQARRETIGSQNEHEKTQVASLEQCITSENKGFKLLAKMGWKEGQSLGKEGTGALEPVKLVSNIGTSGMGSKETAVQTFKTNKTEVWTKTRERYDQLSQDKT